MHLLDIHITFRNHAVNIDNTTGQTHVFKYDHTQCQYEVFAAEDTDLISDFIVSALPPGSWSFIED
jgi:hypothetical protein